MNCLGLVFQIADRLAVKQVGALLAYNAVDWVMSARLHIDIASFAWGSCDRKIIMHCVLA